MNRSRTRTGAQPRITRYARNNRAGQIANPLTELPVYGGFWADDPAWTDNPGVGQAVSSWRNGGTLAASGAYLDPTLGLVLPGVVANGASVANFAALNTLTELELISLVYLPDVTPSATQYAFGHWVAPNAHFTPYIATTGTIGLSWSPDGTTALSIATTETLGSVGIADGSWVWIRRRFQPDNGAAGRTLTVHYSTDSPTTDQSAVTWTLLGTATVAGASSLYTGSTATLWFGALSSAGISWAGKIGYVQINASIGGAAILAVDFRRTSVGAFTCSTGQTVTVASTFNALQATAGSRPTLTTSATLGGRRVVDFDGTDDRLEITTGVSLAQPFEVWWIGVLDTIPSRNIVGLLSTNATAGVTASAGSAFGIGSGGTNITAGSASSTGTAYLLRGVFNGASSLLDQNGANIASGTIGSFTVDQIVLGAGRVAPSTYSRFQDGRTAFLGLLPAASITATHRRQFALWAASFYSVPGFAAAA